MTAKYRIKQYQHLGRIRWQQSRTLRRRNEEAGESDPGYRCEAGVANAPTALISLYELMQKSDWRLAFIIGVPVGFVNVEAAKELILKTDVPHIVNRGRKGGSNVAAAIVNALLYQIRPV